MNQELPSPRVWAKLVSMNQEHKNLSLETDRTEGLFDNQLTISQNLDGEVFVKNLSACSLHIDDNILESNQERKLFGGERLSFSLQENGRLSAKFDYIFCLVSFQSSLKRDRGEAIEPQSLEKLAKIASDFQKELVCSICTNPFQKCMVLIPCQHTFCSFCTFHQLKSSNKCPLCRVEAVSVTKNPLLSNLVQLTVDSFPIEKRSQDGKELEEINLGGMIVREKNGIYIASLVKSQRDGEGKFIDKDGKIYEGSWKKGQKEGKGVEVYSSGDKYDGSWMNDDYHGMGKYTWKNGNEYEGDFEEGDFTGYGTMKYANGSIYKGEWKGDDEEGHGILTLPSGDQYEGEWLEGVLQPKVSIQYSNGVNMKEKLRLKISRSMEKGFSS